MKNGAPAIFFATVFCVSLMVGAPAVLVAYANFFPGDALIIYSPLSSVVYTNTSIPLSIVASVADPTPEVVSITYSIDESSNVTLTDLNKTLRNPGHIDGSQFYVEVSLESLSEGNHTLRAFSLDAAGRQMSALVEFVIDTSFRSPLSVLSPKNITYTATDVTLIFVCAEEILHTEDFMRADYVLDGIGAGYITGNLTLTGLSTGKHELTVIVWTVKGVFSETIHFAISQTPDLTPSPSPLPTASPSPTCEPTPGPDTISTALAIAVVVLVALGTIALVAVIGAGLLVYLKKRHPKTD